MIVTENELKDIIKNQCIEGRLPCKKAFDLANKYECSVKEIGRLADEISVKVNHCQLGCF